MNSTPIDRTECPDCYNQGVWMSYYEKDYHSEENPSYLRAFFDGKPLEYFNITRHKYYSILTPVLDICDISTDHIHIDDIWETYYKNSNFQLTIEGRSHCSPKDYTVFDLRELNTTMVSYMRGYTGRKRWIPLNDIFDTDDLPVDDYRGRMRFPIFGNRRSHTAIIPDEYVVDSRENKDNGCRSEYYITKAKNVKPTKWDEGYVAPKRKEYKCGLTRTELREEWGFIVYVLNDALRLYVNFPIKITGGSIEKLPEVVKLAKTLGITEDIFTKCNHWGDKKPVYLKMFKNPTKYRWEPVKKKKKS